MDRLDVLRKKSDAELVVLMRRIKARLLDAIARKREKIRDGLADSLITSVEKNRFPCIGDHDYTLEEKKLIAMVCQLIVVLEEFVALQSGRGTDA